MGNEINSTSVPIYEKTKNCAHTQKAWNIISEETNSVLQTTDQFLNSDNVSQDDIGELSARLRNLQKAMVDNLENKHAISLDEDIWFNLNKKPISPETIDAVFNELQPLVSLALSDRQGEKIIEKNTHINLTKKEHSTLESSTINEGFFIRNSETSENGYTTANITGDITKNSKTARQKIQEDLHKISDIAFNRKSENTVETIRELYRPEECLNSLNNGHMKDVLASFIDPANKEKFENGVKQTFMETIDKAKATIEIDEMKNADASHNAHIGGVIGIAGAAATIAALCFPPLAGAVAATIGGTTLAATLGFTMKSTNKDLYNRTIQRNQETIKTYEEALNKFNELTKSQ